MFFFFAPERLTSKLSKIMAFLQTGHKHVIKGFKQELPEHAHLSIT